MPFSSSGEVCFYQFDIFGNDIVQGVFTRNGGVSPQPWASLNVGGTVGDDPQRVQENRRLALAALERSPESVFDAWQVHGTDVAIAAAPREPATPHPRADIILTDRPAVTLMMRFADCVPVFLHDPVQKVTGLAHAGWMGTVLGTAKAAVKAMQEQYGSDPADIRAAIGPSIGPDHYEIGPDVAGKVRDAFGVDVKDLLIARGESVYFDLWEANARMLRQAGVGQIETAGVCTVCHNGDWFSHRAEKGRTGRFGAIIALKE